MLSLMAQTMQFVCESTNILCPKAPIHRFVGMRLSYRLAGF